MTDIETLPGIPADADAGKYTPVGTPVQVGEVDDPAVKALLIHFENLGVDCEFGLVQRRYGVEPLGLLRWSFTLPNTLCDLLAHRFEGVGSPNQTRLFTASWGELMLHDPRYDFRMHTFIHEEGVDKAKFLATQCRRLAFLAGKLRDDLANGEKIFVYASADLQPGDETRIHGLMRGYGTNATLLVKLADESHPSGSVAEVADGLYVGYASRFGLTRSADNTYSYWDIDFDTWVGLCRKVLLTGRRFLPAP